jgi:hypothetical protein
MRFWAVLLTMLLTTASAGAQVRAGRPASRMQEVFRGVTPGFRSFPATRSFRSFGTFPRQSVVFAPQVPYYPYYPYNDPYYGSPYYSLPAYSTPDQSATDAQINNLNGQIQTLENQVQLLQDELAATRAQQIPPSPLQANPATPPAPIIPTTLVFRDGHQTEIQGYAVLGSTLWTSYQDGFRKIPLSDLNLDATRKENLKRGVNFLPQR